MGLELVLLGVTLVQVAVVQWKHHPHAQNSKLIFKELHLFL